MTNIYRPDIRERQEPSYELERTCVASVSVKLDNITNNITYFIISEWKLTINNHNEFENFSFKYIVIYDTIHYYNLGLYTLLKGRFFSKKEKDK